MTRRAVFALLLRSCLAVLLAHGQLVAVLHEMHHLTERAAHSEQGPPGSHPCAKCMALAPLHGAVANGTVSLPKLPYDPAVFAEPTYAFFPRVIVPFDSQGPPVRYSAIA